MLPFIPPRLLQLLLRLIDRIEHAAIGEMRLLCVGPATEGVIDGVELDLRELLRQRGRNGRGTRPIEVAPRDLLAPLAIQILEVSLSQLAPAMPMHDLANNGHWRSSTG